jgi:hypothetical protein
MGPVKAYAADLNKIDKMKTAKRSRSVPYAVGCGLSAVQTPRTKIINIEEIPTIPSMKDLVRQGAPVPTTANNPNRLTKI